MTLYDTRNPSRRGTLIEWIRPRGEEAWAIVRFAGNELVRIPERRVRIVGDKLTVRQRIAMNAAGIDLNELMRRAEACGLTLEDAAEALCE